VAVDGSKQWTVELGIILAAPKANCPMFASTSKIIVVHLKSNDVVIVLIIEIHPSLLDSWPLHNSLGA